MRAAKPRGLKRKCAELVRRIRAEVQSFPERTAEEKYWHMHLPVSQAFIDSPKTPKSIRRLCMQELLDATSHLMSIRPSNTKAKVVTAIDLPNLFDSQIIIFFSEEYFDSFFNRESGEQRWLSLASNRSLAREWNLNIPPRFCEKGFQEIIQDEDYAHTGEVWFFGELKL